MTREKLRETAEVVAKAGGLDPKQAPGLEEILVIVVREAVEEAAREVGSQPDHIVEGGVGYAPIDAAMARIRALKPAVAPEGR